jgi:hypothetical protein
MVSTWLILRGISSVFAAAGNVANSMGFVGEVMGFGKR